jgi:pimeloyl-ACP methyl ester carboxylesterase
LIDKLGARRIDLVGHDWGGAITYATRLRFAPRRVRRAVTLALPPAHLLALALAGAQMRRSWYMALFQIPGSTGSYARMAWRSSIICGAGGHRSTTIGVLQPSSQALPRAAQPGGRRVRDARRTSAGRLDLTAALRELGASRARLVETGDDERRRIERDLHDGTLWLTDSATKTTDAFSRPPHIRGACSILRCKSRRLPR